MPAAQCSVMVWHLDLQRHLPDTGLLKGCRAHQRQEGLHCQLSAQAPQRQRALFASPEHRVGKRDLTTAALPSLMAASSFEWLARYPSKFLAASDNLPEASVGKCNGTKTEAASSVLFCYLLLYSMLQHVKSSQVRSCCTKLVYIYIHILSCYIF